MRATVKHKRQRIDDSINKQTKQNEANGIENEDIRIIKLSSVIKNEI